MWTVDCLHDVWLVACILLVAVCWAPAFQFWLFARWLLLVGRVLVPVPRHGRPPLFAGYVDGFLHVVGRWMLRVYNFMVVESMISA